MKERTTGLLIGTLSALFFIMWLDYMITTEIYNKQGDPLELDLNELDQATCVCKCVRCNEKP